MPSSKWFKNKAALAADDNISMSQKPDMCKFQILKSKRSDAGEYELELENSSGKINVPVTLKVIGLFFALFIVMFARLLQLLIEPFNGLWLSSADDRRCEIFFYCFLVRSLTTVSADERFNNYSVLYVESQAALWNKRLSDVCRSADF